VLSAVVLFLAAALPASSQTDAKAVMAGVYHQDTSRDVTLRATMDVIGKDGHGVKKRFTLRRIGSFGNGKTLVRFTDPPEIRGVTLLSINQPGANDRQWIYIPATQRVPQPSACAASPRASARSDLRAATLLMRTSPSDLLTILRTGCSPQRI
jgi:hypothetical protein